MAEYKTARAFGMDEFVEKKSRFIGHISPVSTEEEALAFLAEIRGKNRGANHNVFAYILRENNISRASDDGEPQGTGGVPVLNVLGGNGLTDVCCVVTRYFGGTLLGVGGLIRAYGEGAKLAVAAGGVRVMAESTDLLVRCSYDLYGRLEHYIGEHGVLVLSTEFGENVSTAVRLRKEDVLKFTDDVTELTSALAKTEVLSTGWNEMN